LFNLIFTYIFLLIIYYPSLCFGNLVPNPEFITFQEDVLSPQSWHHGETNIEGIRKSEFSIGPVGSPPLRALGIKGGDDRIAEWWCNIKGLENRENYRLSFKVYREDYKEGIFPEIEIFNKTIKLNNHLTYGRWQDFVFNIKAIDKSTILKFINNHPVQFYFSSPVLVKINEKLEVGTLSEEKTTTYKGKEIFPLITYGAKVENFAFIKDIGFNGVVVGINSRNIEEVIGGSRQESLLIVARAEDRQLVERLALYDRFLGWYVEDEPEGRSVPIEKILNRVDVIRETGSTHPTFMAMVRPEFVKHYRDAADIILMDQYPIPNEPIIWLSRSMDIAKEQSGGKKIWAVIQIFGGQGWKGKGWDREPTYDEMRALSYLAIVHGAKGLFFYTIQDSNYDLRRNDTHLDDVRRLIQELKFISPIFLFKTVKVLEFSADPLYEYAPDGSRPVHARMFQDNSNLFLVAVNVLDKPVKGRIIGIEGEIDYFDEYFSGKRHVIKNHNIVDAFNPYEAKLYIAGKDFLKIAIVDSLSGTTKANFYGEVTETHLEKTLGLMFRDLPYDDRAVFFKADENKIMRISTLNMKEPFDYLFLDEENRISDIYEKVPPCDKDSECRHFASRGISRGVIGVRGGIVDRFGIDIGDRVEVY